MFAGLMIKVLTAAQSNWIKTYNKISCVFLKYAEFHPVQRELYRFH